MRTETATQNKKEDVDHVLGLFGLRAIGGVIAEIPEKRKRNNHDRYTTIGTVQNVHKDHFNSI